MIARTARRVLLSAGIFLTGACASIDAATLITFDTDPDGNPITAPGLFNQTTALQDLYAAWGVHFQGPSALDGGAILNQNAGFGVTALSGSNFLAFNSGALLADGGVPRAPETILFDEAQFEVSFMIAGGTVNVTFTLSVYDENDQLLESQETTTANWKQVKFTVEGIRKLVIAPRFGATSFVVEDLYFDSFIVPNIGVPEPSSVVLIACGAACGPVVVWRSRRREHSRRSKG